MKTTLLVCSTLPIHPRDRITIASVPIENYDAVAERRDRKKKYRKGKRRNFCEKTCIPRSIFRRCREIKRRGNFASFLFFFFFFFLYLVLSFVCQEKERERGMTNRQRSRVRYTTLEGCRLCTLDLGF